jgi:hypothetical protein
MLGSMRAAVGAALTTAFVVGCTITSSPASAEPISMTWNADATTTVKKLGQRIVFPRTTFAATVTPSTSSGTITGRLDLPAAVSTTRLGSLVLATMTLKTADASPVAGTAIFDGPVWHVTARQSFRIKLLRISPLGLPWINLVGPYCQTGMTTATLTGDIDFTKLGQPGGPTDYNMSGNYTIPSFSGCGWLLTPALNALVSGPGNPLNVHFTS